MTKTTKAVDEDGGNERRSRDHKDKINTETRNKVEWRKMIRGRTRQRRTPMRSQKSRYQNTKRKHTNENDDESMRVKRQARSLQGISKCNNK